VYKLTKFERENYILREIFKNDELVLKDWTKNEIIPKNSLSYLINSLESDGFIKKKANKPMVIGFSHTISKILLLIEKNNDISNNELIKNFSNNKIDDIIERLRDAKLIKMESRNKKIYFKII